MINGVPVKRKPFDREKNMPSKLGKVIPTRQSGEEPFRNAGETLSFDVLSFWQWSASDLLSNATRGILVEYIVARALDASPDGVRDEWAAFDLLTGNGTKVEVKSAAYVQSWHQNKLSNICFSMALSPLSVDS